jgi:hypothetical protein
LVPIEADGFNGCPLNVDSGVVVSIQFETATLTLKNPRFQWHVLNMSTCAALAGRSLEARDEDDLLATLLSDPFQC